ncbi:MAG: DUF2490 domain-containing protein [Bacteroidetes bacterium]|nr:DUF2490 domain-containing protein [Bacteroidota bacterium]
MNKIRILFFLVLFSNVAPYAQQKDFTTWNYVNLNYKLNERWQVSFSEQIMRNENASEWWLFLHDLSLSHRITQHLSQELHLRLINQKRLDDNFEDREMIYYALNGRLSWKGWTMSARTRWQGMAYGTHFKDAYKGPYYYHRFRVGIARSINYHWRAGLNVELFQPLNRPERAPFDQVRWGAGMSYRLNRHLSIDHIFQIQQQINRKNPYTFYVWGIGCNFTL